MTEKPFIFQTTPEEQVDLHRLVHKMMMEGLDTGFSFEVYRLGIKDQGVYDLVVLWSRAGPDERPKILEDLQASLDDHRRP